MIVARELEMDVPADRVWKVLAQDFAKISEWYSGVPHSQPKTDADVPQGADVGGRICKVPGLGEIHEKFTNYDTAKKHFAYDVFGMPFFVKAARSVYDVETLEGGKSKVSLQAITEFKPVIGWLMVLPLKLQLNKLMGQLLEELKHYVEKGEIHPRKKKKIPNGQ